MRKEEATRSHNASRQDASPGGPQGRTSGTDRLGSHAPEALFGDTLSAPESAAWSVPWADLMMVMFILFVVLFIYATRFDTLPEFFRPGEKGTEVSAGSGPPLMYDRREILDDVRLTALMEDLRVRLGAFGSAVEVSHAAEAEGGGVRITLKGESFFPRNEAVPGREVYPALKQVGEVLIKTRTPIRITGYADEDISVSGLGPWEISALRAARAARYFTGSLGLEPERFEVRGFAMNNPRRPASSDSANPESQRIEIVITGHYR